MPRGGGVLRRRRLLDLAVAPSHDFGRAVVHILHGDIEYYYDLAVRHDPIVHAFVAYSRRMYDELLARLPHRADTIFHLPYGIPLPAERAPAAGWAAAADLRRAPRTGAEGRLRPAGDRSRAAGGGRPRGVDGRRRRSRRRRAAAALGVQPARPLDRARCTNAELLALYAEQDVFVLPTRARRAFPSRWSKRWRPASCRS